MGNETYLCNELDSADIRSQYDAHARRLLKDKGVLAYILKYAVEEFKDYSLEEAKSAINGEPEVASHPVRPTGEAIQCLENESNIPGENKLFFDIVFTVKTKGAGQQKLYINLEAQKSYYPGYDLVTRGVIYSARLLSEQMDKEYTANNYDGAKKVYSVWICMNTPGSNIDSTKVADTITEYSLMPKTIYSNGVIDNKSIGRYDLLSVVFVCLQDNTVNSSNQLIGMLSTLLSPKMPLKEKKQVLEKDYDLPMTKEMEGEAAAMCNLSEAIAEEAVIEQSKVIQAQAKELQAKKEEIEALKAKIAQLESQKQSL